MAIDIMQYAPFVAPGLSGPEYQSRELQIMLETTFKTMVVDGKIQTLWGRVVPADGNVEIDPTLYVDDAIKKLDAAGIEKTTLICMKMWSYYHHHRLITDFPEDVVAEALKVAPDRFIGGAGYNPFRIDESLRRIEQAVRDEGFSYVWFHPITFGLKANDRRNYPLYAKCVELGIPVGLQVGHSAEVLPSEVGRPYYVDDVAMEFPTLKINLSHTGWPWTNELISMCWRHPNVYGDISAYFPKAVDPDLIQFLNSSRGRNKIMFGTNGFDPVRCIKEIEELPISDKSRERLLTTNAEEFLGLR
jgi:predicted TIM-barrel fold metal-dependent hydrolase